MYTMGLNYLHVGILYSVDMLWLPIKDGWTFLYKHAQLCGIAVIVLCVPKEELLIRPWHKNTNYMFLHISLLIIIKAGIIKYCIIIPTY